MNRLSPTSGDVDVIMVRLAMVENMGVAVVIMSVCCWKLKLHRPTENLRFFHGGCPWFSRSLQVMERATFTRKTSKHPELDPLGIGFDRILKFARVAKIAENNIGGGANLHPPAVRGLMLRLPEIISHSFFGPHMLLVSFFSFRLSSVSFTKLLE